MLAKDCRWVTWPASQGVDRTTPAGIDGGVGGKARVNRSAVITFAASASYRETVERCIRLGHDTDTTAAIAGGLAGLRWGMDETAGGIPADWLEGLRGRELVEEILATAG